VRARSIGTSRYGVVLCRSARPSRRPRPARGGPGPSKLNSVASLAWRRSRLSERRGRRCSRRIRSSDVERHAPHDINESDSLRSKSSGFPRKEVIQPHLPVRLPCYDFTPIIDPTFDGCLPEGLAHRLRVLPTFVV
jgi:hypothetical protein